MDNIRFKDSGDGLKEVFDTYNAWSGLLTSHSIQLSFAIIAANWAVYKSTEAIMSNGWAKASLITVFIFLGLNLILTKVMSTKLIEHYDNSEKDLEKWGKQFEKYKNGEEKDWPYTSCIHNLGNNLRCLKVGLPTLSAIFFVASLIFGS